MPPLARYNLDDDAANTDVADASGNGLDGTASANTDTLSVAAKLGNGFNLAGSHYVALPSGVSSGLGGAAAATFAFWAKRASVGSRHQLIDLTNNGSGSRISIELQAGNTIRAGGRSQVSDGFQYVITTNTFTDTADFHFIVVRYHLPTDSIEVWYDGVLQETTGTPAFTLDAFDSPVGTFQTLGSSDTSYVWNGVLDEVRIYTASSKLLTPGNVARLWNGGYGTENTLPELYAENDGPLRPVLRGS